MTHDTLWLVVGFAGQAFFTCRFLIQWLVSEKQNKSIIPVAFWYFSVLGGATLLTYAIYRHDPVFIMGQSAGLFIYFRNLYFIHKEDHVKEALTAATGPACKQEVSMIEPERLLSVAETATMGGGTIKH